MDGSRQVQSFCELSALHPCANKERSEKRQFRGGQFIVVLRNVRLGG